MRETLASFMKIAFAIFVISALIIGVCFESLKNTNDRYHGKIDQFQTQTK